MCIKNFLVRNTVLYCTKHIIYFLFIFFLQGHPGFVRLVEALCRCSWGRALLARLAGPVGGAALQDLASTVAEVIDISTQ